MSSGFVRKRDGAEERGEPVSRYAGEPVSRTAVCVANPRTGAPAHPLTAPAPPRLRTSARSSKYGGRLWQ